MKIHEMRQSHICVESVFYGVVHYIDSCLRNMLQHYCNLYKVTVHLHQNKRQMDPGKYIFHVVS